MSTAKSSQYPPKSPTTSPAAVLTTTSMLSAPIAAQSREAFAPSIVQSTTSAPSPTTTTLLGPSSTTQPASPVTPTTPAVRIGAFIGFPRYSARYRRSTRAGGAVRTGAL